jgi:hypothetical protein
MPFIASATALFPAVATGSSGTIQYSNDPSSLQPVTAGQQSSLSMRHSLLYMWFGLHRHCARAANEQ